MNPPTMTVAPLGIIATASSAERILIAGSNDRRLDAHHLSRSVEGEPLICIKGACLGRRSLMRAPVHTDPGEHVLPQLIPAAMPNCQVVTIPNVGHSMNLESLVLYAGYFGAWFGGLRGGE
jgi:hypothetical protein